MIKVIIGNPEYVTDKTINVDNKSVNGMEIPNVSNNIWAFSFNETTNKGEIEFQNPQQNNNQFVNSLDELETAIGCTLQSIKDVLTVELQRLQNEAEKVWVIFALWSRRNALNTNASFTFR